MLCHGGAGRGLAAAQSIPPEASGERRTLLALGELLLVGPPSPPACRFLQRSNTSVEHVAVSSIICEKSHHCATRYLLFTGPETPQNGSRNQQERQCAQPRPSQRPEGARHSRSQSLLAWHAMGRHRIYHSGVQACILRSSDGYKGLTCHRLQQAAGRGRVLRYQLLTRHEGAQLICQARQACAVTRAHHHLVCLLQLVQRCCRQGWGSRNLSSLQ